MDHKEQVGWYGVRCVFRHRLPDEPDGCDRFAYEERVTIWPAKSFDEAIAKAEADADDYATTLQCERADFAQAYFMESVPGEGSEVFSLVRDSSLTPSEYIDRYFDDGGERQHG